jgi:hydrogenase-1 operon protein HyaE
LSDVIDSLVAHPACEVVRGADLDDFLRRNPRAVLFFSGDVARRPEGLDVAVVVREIATSYGDRLRIGLVDGRDEAAQMARYGVVMAPAVAWMRDGQATEIVARMRDWSVYAQACDRLLAEHPAESILGIGGNA